MRTTEEILAQLAERIGKNPVAHRFLTFKPTPCLFCSMKARAICRECHAPLCAKHVTPDDVKNPKVGLCRDCRPRYIDAEGKSGVEGEHGRSNEAALANSAAPDDNPKAHDGADSEAPTS